MGARPRWRLDVIVVANIRCGSCNVYGTDSCHASGGAWKFEVALQSLENVCGHGFRLSTDPPLKSSIKQRRQISPCRR
jgi:hypothetical protein